MREEHEERFENFYKQGDPSAGDLLHALLHRLEDLGVWPAMKETNFRRLNKVSLAVLALALDIPYPLPSCEH